MFAKEYRDTRTTALERLKQYNEGADHGNDFFALAEVISRFP